MSCTRPRAAGPWAASFVFLEPRYARARAPHALLSAYPTIASLVHRMTDPRPEQARARPTGSARSCSPSSSAPSASFRARPALGRNPRRRVLHPMIASKRFYGADPEEREALFFAALTEVVDQVDVSERRDQMHAKYVARARRWSES